MSLNKRRSPPTRSASLEQATARQLSECVEHTPTLVYSEEIVAQNCTTVQRALQSISSLDAEVAFAVKACYSLPVLRIIADRGLGAEVISELEFRLARGAGFSDGRIVCNGAGRSDACLSLAAKCSWLTTFDSPADFDRFCSMASDHDLPKLGIRVPAGRCRPTKLGVSLNPTTLRAWFGTTRHKPAPIVALHTHFGDREVSAARYIAALREMRRAANVVERTLGTTIAAVDIGGGICESGEASVDAYDLFRGIGRACAQYLPGVKLVLEPGRFIVGDAGFLATTVLDVKVRAGRVDVIVDAGTNLLIPVASAKYRLVFPPGPANGEGVRLDVVDGITNPRNVIVRGAYLSTIPGRGDRLVLGSCGAYTTSMASFWVYDVPPVLLYRSDGHLEVALSRRRLLRARRLLLGV